MSSGVRSKFVFVGITVITSLIVTFLLRPYIFEPHDASVSCNKYTFHSSKIIVWS